MSFDALTLTAVRDELEPALTDGRLQRLVFVDELSLAVECFRPGVGSTFVLLSAHPEHGRVQRLDAFPGRGLEKDTPFSLLVRKHMRAARIHSIRQPRLERVLELDCEQHDASGQQYRVSLIVEAMGRRGNLVLVDAADGTIMDAARRSPPSRNPRRPVLPHLAYAPPPPQARLLPEELSAERLRLESSGRTSTLARFLSDTLAGLSPLAGRELSFRAIGSVDAPLEATDWQHVVEVARAFFAPVDRHNWQPTLALREGAPEAFAPYELMHLAVQGATVRHCSSISDAIAIYYASARTPQRGDPLGAERRALAPLLERGIGSTQRRVRALELQLQSGQSQREPLRRAGELLLTHQADVPPSSTGVSLDGDEIALDPDLSAVENAQAYFARYRKAREAEERVPELLEDARHHLEYLHELRA
ncbi:MAG: NFACT family protein, partial [Chloroflexi bacterium]|nr:NFACT family protein [Chloroflexota bacterium]